MGYTGEPVFNLGDFLAFYTGDFGNITEDSNIYLAKVTEVNGSTVTYEKTTAEEMEKSQDMFIENPISGDELLENIDRDALEGQR